MSCLPILMDPSGLGQWVGFIFLGKPVGLSTLAISSLVLFLLCLFFKSKPPPYQSLGTSLGEPRWSGGRELISLPSSMATSESQVAPSQAFQRGAAALPEEASSLYCPCGKGVLWLWNFDDKTSKFGFLCLNSATLWVSQHCSVAGRPLLKEELWVLDEQVSCHFQHLPEPSRLTCSLYHSGHFSFIWKTKFSGFTTGPNKTSSPYFLLQWFSSCFVTKNVWFKLHFKKKCIFNCLRSIIKRKLSYMHPMWNANS